MTPYLLWSGLVMTFSILYLATEKLNKRVFKIEAFQVSYESAQVALEKIGSWTTWLTGLQTAAMAAMALLVKDECLSDYQKDYGFFTILFFGASIILSTWVISAIPSIQQRLINSTAPSIENDIYTKRIFSFIPFTLGRFSGLIHWYFLIGIVFFSLFIFSFFE